MPTHRILSSRDITQKCSLGCPILDRVLGGGVPCRSITELAGESTAAKTQTCLQLALHAQLPLSAGGLAGSCLYVYTEGRFPLDRLHELAALRYPEWTLGGGGPCDNVFITQVYTPEELQSFLEWRLPLQLKQPSSRPLRLLIIDSIAAIFRGEVDIAVTERASMLFCVSKHLRLLADKYNVAVVVTNQATDVIAENGKVSRSELGTSEIVSSGRKVVASLGLAWSNCISTRIFLSKTSIRTNELLQQFSDAERAILERGCREMSVIFSPHLPPASCTYVVEASGVRGLHGSSECSAEKELTCNERQMSLS